MSGGSGNYSTLLKEDQGVICMSGGSGNYSIKRGSGSYLQYMSEGSGNYSSLLKEDQGVIYMSGGSGNYVHSTVEEVDF
jgi:hypothetical protein